MMWMVWVALAAASEVSNWAAAMASGDCATVIAALTAPEADAERLAAGRCLVRTGQSGRALEVLSAPMSASLLPYGALLRAQALLDRDRPTDAVAALEGVVVPGSDDELLRGRALVQARRSLEARDGLRALLEGPTADEARFWLAVGAVDRGDLGAAIPTFQAVWSRHPTSAWAAKAAERLMELGRPVPDYTTPEGRALELSRAQRLLELQQAAMAVPVLDAIHTQEPFDSPEESLAFAEALFDARLYARAVEWFERSGGQQSSAGVSFRYALAVARSGRYDDAAPLYQELAERFPTSREADEATFKLPYMQYDARNYDAAIAGFADYLAARPTGKFATDARWFTAWAHYKLGHRAEAEAAFGAVLRADPGTDLAIAARYWRARLAEDRAELAALLKEHPDTGYAWFAAWQLDHRFPATTITPPPTLPTELEPHVATARALIGAGLLDWARPLLQAQVGAAKSAGQRGALGMAALLLEAEDYPGAQALAKPYCGSVAAAVSICHPRPHRATVEVLARQGGLHPLLPYAIMNAESGVNPSVTSPAGARGLMQLMPELATGLASDIPGFSIDDLYRAGVNARLGTKELTLLQARFQRSVIQPSLPLVIAAYNGGPEAVERWLGTYSSAPAVDEFAEDISYTETRRYVRRVLGFLMRYRRVYGD